MLLKLKACTCITFRKMNSKGPFLRNVKTKDCLVKAKFKTHFTGVHFHWKNNCHHWHHGQTNHYFLSCIKTEITRNSLLLWDPGCYDLASHFYSTNNPADSEIFGGSIFNNCLQGAISPFSEKTPHKLLKKSFFPFIFLFSVS